jgi:hypothetical protein
LASARPCLLQVRRLSWRRPWTATSAASKVHPFPLLRHPFPHFGVRSVLSSILLRRCLLVLVCACAVFAGLELLVLRRLHCSAYHLIAGGSNRKH